MNENLNLVEILKDCPKGTKLYSTVFGEVEFEGINDIIGPIIVTTDTGKAECFTADGKMYTYYSSDCLLFPSRDQRDWSKFDLKKPKFKVGDKIVNIPRKYMGASGTQGVISKITDDKYIFTDGSYILISNQYSWELVNDKKPKFDPKTFQPFDKVLVRDSDVGDWKVQLFSHIKKEEEFYPYVCINESYTYCIPCNKDTEHLVGTSEEAPEFYRYWEE